MALASCDIDIVEICDTVCSGLGVDCSEPMARMKTWGGLMTAVKFVMPNIPRFETLEE